MEFKSILRRSWSAYRRGWLRLVPMGFFLYFWLALAAKITESWGREPAAIVAFALLLLGQFFLLAFHVVDEFGPHGEGRAEENMTASLRKLAQCCLPLLVVGLIGILGLFAAIAGALVALAIAGGMAATVASVVLWAPLVLVLTRCSLVAPVIMLDERKVRPALRRSNELVKGATLKVLLLLLVAEGIATFARGLLGAALGAAMMHEDTELRAFVIDVVAEGLTAAYFVIVVGHLYRDLSERRAPAAQPVPVPA